MQLDALKRMYFLGIGGIGMSALARYFLGKGIEIYGYDLSKSSLTKKLEAEGMKIHYEEDIDLIPGNIDLVVYTPAIPSDHKEFQWFLKNDFQVKKRAEVLGLVSKDHFTIAVAGTHGKTSTSSIISHVLKYCGLDISAFLGGILAEQNSNYIAGQSNVVVLEADEYDRSFLHLQPSVLIITSLDADHLDVYGSHAKMLEAYEQLSLLIVEGGSLILMGDFESMFSDNWKAEIENRNINLLKCHQDFRYLNIRIEDESYKFDYLDDAGSIQALKSVMPGVHNISNSSAAIKVARLQGFSEEKITEALAAFKGIRRRFEVVHEGSFVLIDDYAHHPTELNRVVKTIKDLYPDRHVLGIFQAHLFSRTSDFYREFAKELKDLDEIWILEIYPAREKPIVGIKAELIYNLIRNDNKKLLNTSELLEALRERKGSVDVLMTIGASDIDKYHKEIIKNLE